jgi:hypothetical protein
MYKAGHIYGYVAAVGLTLAAAVAQSAPQIATYSGTVSHGAQVTLTGSGFGAKATAAPAVWDNCPSAGVSSQWSGVWPNASQNATYNLACRTPIRGVPLPHSHVTMYMAGAHAESGGYNAGYDVIAFKNRNITSYPTNAYFSWYERNDPLWVFNLGSPADNNHKLWDFSQGTSPYSMPPNWYLEHNPRFQSATDKSGSFHLNDDSGLMTNAVSTWGSGNPPSPWQGWVKMEVLVTYATDTSGRVRMYANNKLYFDVAGLNTDPLSGSARSEGIGGYTRNYGNANNWRYFSDMYIDYSFSRIVLANSATYANATVVEIQPAVSWSDGQVGFAANLGAFSSTDTIYAFVFDASGTPNATGFKLAAGAPAPQPPSSLTVK